MTTPAPSFRSRILGPGDSGELERFLRTDPIAFLYPLGWLLRDGIAPRVRYLQFRFVGTGAQPPRLDAAGLLAGRVLLFVAAKDPEAARALAAAEVIPPRDFRVVVGPRRVVQAAWEVLETRRRKARLRRPQRVYTVDAKRLQRFRAPELRLATPEDLKPVLAATIDMHQQEAREKLELTDVDTFRRSIAYQIDQQRIWVWREPDELSVRFKAAVTASCDAGAQLEGVYVAPEFRGHGHARHALSELCQRLLAHVPRVSLYVNEDNLPAMHLYEHSLGFEPSCEFETIFVGE